MNNKYRYILELESDNWYKVSDLKIIDFVIKLCEDLLKKEQLDKNSMDDKISKPPEDD